ncbi:MAG TPA: hypothetical protein VFB62_04225 [Polyangiaceae bacterium]|jgi:hypothetical protein|nr:hypothetical protein [Polyangiaceae bacterium]
MKWYCAALLLCLVACKKDPPAEKKEEKKSGEEECKTYIDAMDKCIAKLPAEQKEQMQKQRDLQAEAVKNAPAVAKDQMADTCRMGYATLKQDPRCK